MYLGHRKQKKTNGRHMEAFCDCWEKTVPMKQLVFCDCGEGEGGDEWNWEVPTGAAATALVVERPSRSVVFHPYYSTGTAAARGDTPFVMGYHYYWEVKLLSEAYGTDIMIGVGSDKADVEKFQFKFNSLLGTDEESYGLSYKGYVCHDSLISREGKGFCKGSIVGVRLDLFMGTLEFFINRQPQGISFYNLKRHNMLYPIICSTAAHSNMRLIYTGSWRASLLVDALKLLARKNRAITVPPGMADKFAFWMTTPPGDSYDGVLHKSRPLLLPDIETTFSFEDRSSPEHEPVPFNPMSSVPFIIPDGPIAETMERHLPRSLHNSLASFTSTILFIQALWLWALGNIRDFWDIIWLFIILWMAPFTTLLFCTLLSIS